MRTKRFKQRPLAIALAGTLAIGGINAYAADVEVRTPAGGGFAVRDSGGSILRLFVDGATGEVTVPQLVSAPQQPNVVCFQTATGMLGQCAPGSADRAAGTARCAGCPRHSRWAGWSGLAGRTGRDGSSGTARGCRRPGSARDDWRPRSAGHSRGARCAGSDRFARHDRRTRPNRLAGHDRCARRGRIHGAERRRRTRDGVGGGWRFLHRHHHRCHLRTQDDRSLGRTDVTDRSTGSARHGGHRRCARFDRRARPAGFARHGGHRRHPRLDGFPGSTGIPRFARDARHDRRAGSAGSNRFARHDRRT